MTARPSLVGGNQRQPDSGCGDWAIFCPRPLFMRRHLAFKTNHVSHPSDCCCYPTLLLRIKHMTTVSVHWEKHYTCTRVLSFNASFRLCLFLFFTLSLSMVKWDKVKLKYIGWEGETLVLSNFKLGFNKRWESVSQEEL